LRLLRDGVADGPVEETTTFSATVPAKPFKLPR